MRRNLVFLIICLISFNSRIHSQVLKPFHIDYFHYKVPQRVLEQPVNMEKGFFYSNRPIVYSGLQFPGEYNFKYTLPKGAIFCRMEDAIYGKLNFWIKFRMGTDDKYSN